MPAGGWGGGLSRLRSCQHILDNYLVVSRYVSVTMYQFQFQSYFTSFQFYLFYMFVDFVLFLFLFYFGLCVACFMFYLCAFCVCVCVFHVSLMFDLCYVLLVLCYLFMC